MIRNVLEGVGQAKLSFKSNDLSVIDPKTKPKTLEVFDDQVFHLLTHAYFLYESIFLYFFFGLLRKIQMVLGGIDTPASFTQRCD